jgi:nitrogen fixation protein NifX
MTNLHDNLALRLGLSAKALPLIGLEKLIQALISELGDPLSEKKLRKLSPKKLYSLLSNINNDVERSQCNHAFAILTNDEVSEMAAPSIEQPNSLTGPKLRIAISSNSDENLDGHFGSCLRMLVYDVTASEFNLVSIRNVDTHEHGLARTDYLTELIEDCHLLGTLSIGGPAAAKVTRADIHPIKQPTPCPTSELLERIQAVLQGTPPKWIQKILEKQEATAL